MTGSVGMEAIAAYRAAMKRLNEAEPASPAEGATSFETLLSNELGSNIEMLKVAEQASIGGLSGAISTQQVVEALTSAELSLQKVTAFVIA